MAVQSRAASFDNHLKTSPAHAEAASACDTPFRTMACQKSHSVLLIVHRTDCPTDDEWDCMTARMGVADYENIVIVTEGARPSLAQCVRVVRFWSTRRMPKFAVIAPSAAVRGLWVAFGPAMRNARSYMPEQTRAALQFCGVREEDMAAVQTDIAEISARLAGAQEGRVFARLAAAMLGGDELAANYTSSDISDLLHAAGPEAITLLGVSRVAKALFDAGQLHRAAGEYGAAAFDLLMSDRLQKSHTAGVAIDDAQAQIVFAEGCTICFQPPILALHLQRRIDAARRIHASYIDAGSARERLSKAYGGFAKRDTHMAGGFAHLIRNALTPGSIRATLSLKAMRAADASGHEVHDTLDVVNRSMERALSTTDQILRYAELATAAATRTEVSLQRAISNVEQQFSDLICQSGVQLKHHASKEVTVHCSAGHLHIILEEVYRNALEAMSKIKPTKRRTLRLHIDADATVANIALTDSAGGMSAEVEARALEPFFTTEPGRRLGLGLPLVEKLVAVYGGSLVVGSVKGRGCTIVITLPRQQDSHGITNPISF